MLNKVIAYIGILIVFILMGFVVDIYLTFAQLNEHNSFIAYGYMMLYLILIGFITFYILLLAMFDFLYILTLLSVTNHFNKKHNY